MVSKLSSHARHNVVAYLALFFALTGVAYAAGPLKAGDPAGGDLTGTYPDPGVASSIARDSEIFPTVLANDGSASNLDADKLDGLNSRTLAAVGGIVAANGSIVEVVGGNVTVTHDGPGSYLLTIPANELNGRCPVVSVTPVGAFGNLRVSGIGWTCSVEGSPGEIGLTITNPSGSAVDSDFMFILL